MSSLLRNSTLETVFRPFPIGDYEFTKHPDEIDLLKYISEVSSASFAPCIVSAEPSILALESWSEIQTPVDLARIVDSPMNAQWNDFGKTDESRLVTLTMPRTLARRPYGKATGLLLGCLIAKKRFTLNSLGWAT